MSLSDFPPPPHFPPFLRHEQLLRYYESYADFFDLRSRVKFESEVVAIEKADDHVVRILKLYTPCLSRNPKL